MTFKNDDAPLYKFPAAIDRGIPVPKQTRHGSGKWKTLMSQMRPGDSFFIKATPSVASSIRWRVLSATRKHAKLITRIEPKGVRFWLKEKKK